MNDASPTTTLEGYLERLTFYNKENHFTIAKFRTNPTDNLITVLGTMPDPHLGEALKITGTWEIHNRYGEQLRIESYEVVLPASVEDIKKYLASGFIKGIGPKIASRLVNHFNDKTLEIIEKAPQRLIEVKGIGKENAAHIADAWKNHCAIRNLIRFMHEHGIKTSYSSKILKAYGPDAINIIQQDPYRLTEDLPGIGFYIADAIVQKSGVAVDEAKRVKACIFHLVQQISDEGHVFIYLDQLLERCEKRFQINADAARDGVAVLEEQGELVIAKDAVDSEAQVIYPKILYQAETGISNKLKALLSVPVPNPDMSPESITSAVLNKLAIQLSAEQLDVLEGILSHRVAIITGGPGTGKTTLIRSITAIFGFLGKQILLAAPTGRAARRLAEITGRKAETIHKLLGYNVKDDGFDKNQDNPLHADVVIIDEASMVDTLLMYHMLKAVHMTSRLILVGDVFQLPSVGPGNILSDIITSGRLKTFELKKIFRQAQKSPIVINAHKIRQGKPPDLSKTGTRLSEFYFIEQHDPDSVVKTISELCKKKIPEHLDVDGAKDIQVLAPMHKGIVGTFHLNQVLQKVLNPNPVILKTTGSTYKIGDKVMHLKNNYRKEVFNGDIGSILSVEKENETLCVDYDGRPVSYDFSELDEIALAYAISVHKSQGSEYPAVIVPLMTQHFPLLQRNLLYTAITRGKKMVILIGTPRALAIALKNDTPQRRLSGLARRLNK